jgi:crotonobetainyl-CoA:carnitine CoA-transferase CaiB-like acyl-CoA transferase
MPLPLEGVKVLDLSRILAGPYATQALGDLGAEVWKIERPGAGDDTRGWGPPFVAGMSAYYLSLNRNKKSAALDFRDPAHHRAILRAVSEADIVVENFVPGHLAPFGLDPATLRTRHPELIVCSISGYGQDGPYAMQPGYDLALQGFTGLMSITGHPDQPPVRVGVAVIDVLTGVHAATAILAALVGRMRGQGGAHLDVSLFEVGMASLATAAQGTLVTGTPARRHGTAHGAIVPYQGFESADGMFILAVGNDDQWRRLCVAVDAPELAAREAWSHNADRVLHREAVVDALTRIFATRARAHWITVLQAAGVPASPVRELHEAVRDPALAARGMIVPTRLSGGETVELLGSPWRIGSERAPVRIAPPRLGEHTEEFLTRYG